MVKKLMLAIAVLALATPSFAAVQNVKVSGALKTTSVIRQEFSATAGARDHQNEIIGQTWLNVGADLTDNVSTMIGLSNERAWGTTENGTNSSFLVDAANVTMKELFYAPLTVTVGRQTLAYGNQLIIGDGDASASQVTGGNLGDLTGGVNFDAIKAVLSYDPLTVDLFAARVTTTSVAAVVGKSKDVNLYGVNANYKMGDKMSTVVEGYVFINDDSSTIAAPNKATRTYVPGLRVSTNPVEGLNLQLEGAYQLGSDNNTNNSTMEGRTGAYALQGMLNYALPVMKDMKPVLGAAYTYLSGAKAGTTNATSKREWNSMYENQNGGRIFDALTLASSNSQLATLSFEVAPLQDLTAKASLNGLWTAEKSAYNGSNNSSKYLGAEADLDLTYAYTEDVKFGVSAGYFMTGKDYVTPNNQNASQLLSSVSVAF